MGFLLTDLTTGVKPEGKTVFKRENIGFAFGASVCVCVCVCARSAVSDSLRPHGL